MTRAIDIFFKSKNQKDGLNPVCKICEKERNKERYSKKHPIVTNSTESINEITFKTTKICKHCKKEKELNQFYKEKRNKDGHREKCKHCCTLAKNTDEIIIVPTITN